MASSGGDGEPEWTAAVRPLLSASYTAFETKELPQLIGSIINRYISRLWISVDNKIYASQCKANVNQ